jgi:hypothetical protein
MFILREAYKIKISGINSPNRVHSSKKIKKKIFPLEFLLFPPSHELLSGKNGRRAGGGRWHEQLYTVPFVLVVA